MKTGVFIFLTFMVTLVDRRRLRPLDCNLLFKANFSINKRRYKLPNLDKSLLVYVHFSFDLLDWLTPCTIMAKVKQ